MAKFKDFLTESFINALPKDEELKRKHVDEVWDIIQHSYKKIGGIKGNGFASKEDMITKIPFWKMVRKGGKIVAVTMYKDKNGRKSIASGTDGSDEGINAIRDIMKNDINRSYGEKSKSALGLLMKTVPWDILKIYVLTPEIVEKQAGKEVKPVKGMNLEELPLDAQRTLNKFPELIEFGYLTTIKNEFVFKVAFGTIIGTNII